MQDYIANFEKTIDRWDNQETQDGDEEKLNRRKEKGNISLPVLSLDIFI